MHLPHWVQKIIMSFLIIGLLLPGAYVALTPAPAEAQWFNTTIFDVTAIVNFVKQIADKIWEVTQLALEIALYKTVKYAVRQLGDQGAQWVGRQISGGAVGQEPLFWEQTPGQMLEQAGEAAGGFFIEGLAESIATDQQGGSGSLKDRRAKGNRGAVLQQAQQIVNQMCNPDPKFKFDLLAGIIGNLSISIGLPIPLFGFLPTKKTEKPACTFTQAYNNWKKVIEDTASAYNNQLLGAIEMAKNLPNQLSDSFSKDIQDINNQFQDLAKIDLGSPTAQADLQRKLNTLQDSIEAKTGVYFTRGDLAIGVSGGTNALNVLKAKTGDAITKLSNDPSIKSQLDAIDLTIKHKTEVRANNIYGGLINSLNTNKDQKIANTAEEVKKMEDKVRETQNARRTGKLTGWQILADLTDPDKASDQAVKSRVQNTLQSFLAKMHEATVLQRTETGGPKPQTTLSGQVTSPPFTVAEIVSKSLGGQVNQEGKFTGKAMVDAADLIGEFTDSIFAKSGQMIMEGLTKTLADQPVEQQGKIDELAQRFSSESDRTTQQLGQEFDSGAFYGSSGGSGDGSAGDFGTETGGVPGVDAPFPETPDEDADIAAETNIPGSSPGGTTAILRPSSDLITNPSASIQAVRRASIEARISRLVALPVSKEEQLNVLSSLQSDCVPGSPDSCTIRPPFSQAIQNKLTIAEAVRKFKQTGGATGLDENAIFGFKRGTAGGAIETDLSLGIPYSSMVILRKYRILPVAWEITALYIKDHNDACGQQNCTLKFVMNQFDTPSSPFYKLIDPHWVLKSPTAKCMLKGYGPPIEQIGAGKDSQNENAQWICRGDPTEDRGVIVTSPPANPPEVQQCKVEYKIQPRSQICLDQQTCLDEDSKGNCKGYGYCLEEKKRWQFSGTECKKQYSSCLSFTNMTTGVTASFLRDSLESATNLGYGSICSANTAGCAWQSKLLTLQPVGQNLLSNPGAEQDAAGWTVLDFGIGSYGGNAQIEPHNPAAGSKNFTAINDGGMTQKVTVQTGATYTLSTRARVHYINDSSDASTGRLVAGTESLNRNLADFSCNLSAYDAPPTVGEWIPCSTTFFVPNQPTTSTTIHVGFRAEGDTHHADFDNLSLVKIGDGSMRSDYQWSDTGKVYFTTKAKDRSCPAEAEGCSALVRQSDVVNFAPQSDTLGDGSGGCGKDGSWGVCPSVNGTSVLTWAEAKGQQSPNGIVESVGKLNQTTGTGSYNYRVQLHKVNHGLDSILGKTFTFSVWFKSSTASSLELALLISDGKYALQNCATTTEWTRCSVTYTTSTTSTDYSRQDELSARIYVNAPSIDYYIYGAQVEQSLFPTDYVKNIPVDRPGATYAKIAPSYYGCDRNLTGSDTAKPIGYKKDICKGFALHCPASYAGCSSYIPVNGDPPVSGIQPLACDAACVGLTRFVQVPNQLEAVTTPTPVKSSYDFIASTAQMCTADQVGCDEYTNLEGGATGGGEQRDYYTAITKCVKKLANPEDQRIARQDIFYSWTGSETGGAQLEKFLVVSKDENTKSPECWKNPAVGMRLAGSTDACECDTKTNGPGRSLCRQFFRLKADGTADTAQSWWRIQDDLVYATESADCAQYRRTADGPTSTNRYYISKSMSKTCSSAQNGCREYHASQAGNITALPPDTFTDKTAGKWLAGPADTAALSLSSTGEGETLGDNSLKVVNSDADKQSITIQKPVALRQGSVLLGFAIKGPANSELSLRLVDSGANDALGLSAEQAQQTGSSTLNTNILNGSWQYFQFAFSNVAVPEQSLPHVRITLDKKGASNLNQFYLDDVTIRQSEGILYVIKDSWHGKAPAQCYVAGANATEKDWDTGVADALFCQTYADKDGNRSTFQRFSGLCPKEMVGCAQFLRADASGNPVSLVDDPKKYCKQEFNKCTAYGIPKMNAKQAVVGYSTAYYTIAHSEIDETNPDYNKGICKFAEAECQEYATKYDPKYFKNPGAAVARWRPAGSICSGTTTRCTKNSDCSGNAACVREVAPNGVWYYMTCGANAADATDTTKCLSDTQCSDGKRCIHEVQLADNNLSLARLCPSAQSTCSKIQDPECRPSDLETPTYMTLRTNYGRMARESGMTCQSEYYYLDDVHGATGQCNGSINVEAGCLLFQSDYLRDKEAPAAYNTADIYRAGSNVALSAATATGTLDANTLVKVKLDRACKTWLGCTDEQVDASGHRTCTERRPCIELDQSGECANFVDTETPAARAEMQELKAAFNTNTTTDTKFASLTGLSRPSIKVKDFPTDSSSIITHDGFFDWGGDKLKIDVAPGRLSAEVPVICRSHPQKDTPTASKELQGKCDTTPTSNMSSKQACSISISCPSGESCKYPQNAAYSPGTLNQCSYARDGNSYLGLQGFCLEKYPKKGYENYCLNWYPTDKPAGALPVFNHSASSNYLKAFKPDNRLINYCIKSEVNTIKARSNWANGNLVKVVAEDKKETVPVTALKLTFKTIEVRTDGDNKCGAYNISPGKHCVAGIGGGAPTGTCSFTDTNCSVRKTGVCGFTTSPRTCEAGSNGGTVIGSCAESNNTSTNSCKVRRVIGSCNVDADYKCEVSNTACNTSTDCDHTENDFFEKGDCINTCVWPASCWWCEKWGSGATGATACSGRANGQDRNKCLAPHRYSDRSCTPRSKRCSNNKNVTCTDNSVCTGDYDDGTCKHPGTQTCNISGGTVCPTSQSSGSSCHLDDRTGICAINNDSQKMSCSTAGANQSTSTQENDDKGYIALEDGSALTAPTIKILKADGTVLDAAYPVPLIKENIQSIDYSVVAWNQFTGGTPGMAIWSGTYPAPGWRDMRKRPDETLRITGIAIADFTKSVFGYANAAPQDCVPSRGKWLVVFPIYVNNELKGFKYILCADHAQVELKATINFKPWKYWSRRETRQLELTDTYCKEFAQVAQGANADSPSSANIIPATRKDDFASNDVINVDPSNKPYSFSTTELLDTREYTVITKDALPTPAELMTTAGTLKDKTYEPADNYPSSLPAAREHSTTDSTTIPEHTEFGIPLPLVKTFTEIRAIFVKIYNFFTLNNAKTSYTSSNTASTASNKTTSGYWVDSINDINDYPLISSRRCATSPPNASVGTEIMCSATKVCQQVGANCSDIRENTFILTFPRESANQQIATMQFFASTQESKTPLRRLLIQWGEGDIKEVYNSVGSTAAGALNDNMNGFSGKVYSATSTAEENKEFTFVHTYATTFWRKSANYNGTNVCIFVQDNWYYWKKVCGRFYKGPGGFIELKKDYGSNVADTLNTVRYSNGWWKDTGKGNFAAPQPAPGKCATQTGVVTPEKTCGINTECDSPQFCKWSW